MIELRHVLCPTDFSTFSERALDHAIGIARESRATVHLLHVLPPLSSALAYVHAPSGLPDPPPAAQVEGAARAELERVSAPARKAGVRTEKRTAWGDTVSTILQVAETIPVDLIVMGTHGRSGFEQLVLGSVADKVLRKAPCPVLTVRDGGVLGVPGRPRNVLCPIDFSVSSKQAMRWGLSLSAHAGGRIHLLHVVELMPELPIAAVMGAGSQVEQVQEHAQEHLQTLIPEVVGETETASLPPREHVTYTVVRGKAHREIVSSADRQAADLIVMGVHGHGAVDRALFGSTTHHVVRDAPCPVLSVRSFLAVAEA